MRVCFVVDFSCPHCHSIAVIIPLCEHTCLEVGEYSLCVHLSVSVFHSLYLCVCIYSVCVCVWECVCVRVREGLLCVSSASHTPHFNISCKGYNTPTQRGQVMADLSLESVLSATKY